mmetsp:Transcript_10107/g.10062  ORF Transcript_10107/g.10062 Transcript_10107/m.10062 type:complete len:97 (+) Transcript_10107:567-857(+)
MLFSFVGEEYSNIFCFRIKKIYFPVLMLIIIYATMPQSSFMGHMCGILSALMIRFCGIYYLPFFLPKQEWLMSFDSMYGAKLSSKVAYFKATDKIH